MSEERTPEPNNHNLPGKDADWERDLLSRFAFASLREQRITRRWGIFFRLPLSMYR